MGIQEIIEEIQISVAESPSKIVYEDKSRLFFIWRSIDPAEQGAIGLWRNRWLHQEMNVDKNPEKRLFQQEKNNRRTFLSSIINGERGWWFCFTYSRIRVMRTNDADNLKFIFNERETAADNEIWKIKREWQMYGLRSRAPTTWYVRYQTLVAMGFSSFLSTAAGECCFFLFVFIFLTFYFWIQRVTVTTHLHCVCAIYSPSQDHFKEKWSGLLTQSANNNKNQ